MEQPRERSWFGRNWKWLIPVGCLLPFVLVGGCVTVLVVGIVSALKTSDAYTMSLAAVRADDQVKAALGDPIEPSFFLSGNINVSTHGGEADVHYDIHGPKGTGTVHAVAEKQAGSWNFKSLRVDLSNGEKVDVLKQLQKADADEAI
jgi:hypothetical protein